MTPPSSAETASTIRNGSSIKTGTESKMRSSRSSESVLRLDVSDSGKLDFKKWTQQQMEKDVISLPGSSIVCPLPVQSSNLMRTKKESPLLELSVQDLVILEEDEEGLADMDELMQQPNADAQADQDDDEDEMIIQEDPRTNRPLKPIPIAGRTILTAQDNSEVDLSSSMKARNEFMEIVRPHPIPSELFFNHAGQPRKPHQHHHHRTLSGAHSLLTSQRRKQQKAQNLANEEETTPFMDLATSRMPLPPSGPRALAMPRRRSSASSSSTESKRSPLIVPGSTSPCIMVRRKSSNATNGSSPRLHCVGSPSSPSGFFPMELHRA